VSDEGDHEIADRSLDRCVRSTWRSVVLRFSAPVALANVETNSSLVKIREVFEVAILDAWSRIALAAAYRGC